MSKVQDIIDRGNAVERFTQDGYTSKVTCADGFHVSIIAGGGAYSTPRTAIPGVNGEVNRGYGCGDLASDYLGPYTAVELGYPSDRPEPWDEFADYVEDADNPTCTVYGQVPAALVLALIASHGGEA